MTDYLNRIDDMNAQIQVLAIEAGLAEAADVRAGYVLPPGTEKFAMLIIQQCLDLATSHGSQQEDYAAGIDCVHERIQEHFGIE
jgi:hypothetical protein